MSEKEVNGEKKVNTTSDLAREFINRETHCCFFVTMKCYMKLKNEEN